MTHEVDVEERLAASMRDHVAGIRVDRGIVARAGRRHRRRKVLRRSAFGAVVLACVAIAGVAAVMGGTGAGEVITPAIYQEGDTSQARLVAAITASQNTSYQVTITTRYERTPGKVEVITGAYDPATDSGYLRTGAVEERVVDGVRYFIKQGMARQIPSFKNSGLVFEFPGEQAFFGTSVDPQVMLEAMRRHDAKIVETGRGVFHFEMTWAHDVPKGRKTVAISGDVTVGADKRVAKVSYATVMTVVMNDKPTPDIKYTTEMEFSNYGAPVRVEKP